MRRGQYIGPLGSYPEPPNPHAQRTVYRATRFLPGTPMRRGQYIGPLGSVLGTPPCAETPHMPFGMFGSAAKAAATPGPLKGMRTTAAVRAATICVRGSSDHSVWRLALCRIS
jgi:hypothetical protein